MKKKLVEMSSAYVSQPPRPPSGPDGPGGHPGPSGPMLNGPPSGPGGPSPGKDCNFSWMPIF